MTVPEPRAGVVIRYAFLWSDEARSGAEEGRKDRPAAIVLASQTTEHGDVLVTVAPITHTPPADPAGAVEIPTQVARSLGLDDRAHWIICDELNRFAWPGFDLRPVPGRSGAIEYGMLPPSLYERMKATVVVRYRSRRLRVTPRD